VPSIGNLLTPCTSLRVVDIDASLVPEISGAHNDHDEGSAMAVEVVTRTATGGGGGGGGTEHRSRPHVWKPCWRLGEFELVA